MSVFNEIRGMISKRLAYRLWLIKEERDLLIFSETRSLIFIRIMTMFFSAATLAAMWFISTKEDAPLPAYLILGLFFLAFFSVFILKSFSHKEVTFTSFDKKIIVQKKRFSTVLWETSFNFDQIKKLTLAKVTRVETKEGHGQRTRTHLEMVMDLSDDHTIHFSVINHPQIALESANKLADFTGVKLISRI